MGRGKDWRDAATSRFTNGRKKANHALNLFQDAVNNEVFMESS